MSEIGNHSNQTSKNPNIDLLDENIKEMDGIVFEIAKKYVCNALPNDLIPGYYFEDENATIICTGIAIDICKSGLIGLGVNGETSFHYFNKGDENWKSVLTEFVENKLIPTLEREVIFLPSLMFWDQAAKLI